MKPFALTLRLMTQNLAITMDPMRRRLGQRTSLESADLIKPVLPHPHLQHPLGLLLNHPPWQRQRLRTLLV